MTSNNHTLKITLMHIINNPKRSEKIRILAKKALEAVLEDERKNNE